MPTVFLRIADVDADISQRLYRLARHHLLIKEFEGTNLVSRLLPQPEIARDAHQWHQREILMNRLDAQFARVVRRFNVHGFVIEEDLAPRQTVESRQHFDQCGFAGAVIPEQADNFLAIDMEVDAAQYLHAAEVLVDINHIHKRVIVFL